MLLEPKQVDIQLRDGGTKSFIISKIPAVAGREILTQWPISAIPKLGDYSRNEELMLKMLCYVAVPTENGEIKLTTRVLVDNHVPDFETLGRIEVAMLEYNCSFFGKGGALIFSDFAKILKSWITQTLTDSLGQSSRKAKRR